MTAPELKVITVEQTDPRLGRHVLHDPRSRAFPLQVTAEPVRRDVMLRVYGPQTIPMQTIGNCTGVAEAVMGDTVGNRVRGVVLGMADAVRIYSRATQLDPWPGTYPPDDTGSSGTSAAQAAVDLGYATGYEWVFNGTDGILSALAVGHPVSVGTWWFQSMFRPDPSSGLVTVGGAKAGGHQWTVIGYRRVLDAFVGLCWWGPAFGLGGRFLIRRQDLADLLADDGDCHVTHRRIP